MVILINLRQESSCDRYIEFICQPSLTQINIFEHFAIKEDFPFTHHLYFISKKARNNIIYFKNMEQGDD